MAGRNIERGGNLINIGQREVILMNIGNQRRYGAVLVFVCVDDAAFHRYRRVLPNVFLENHEELGQLNEYGVVRIVILLFRHFFHNAGDFIVVFRRERNTVVFKDR